MGFTMPRREKVLWPDVPNGIPHPPRNVIITSPFFEGALDIRWDNPGHIPDNITRFKNILGVNIYRSFESAYGPWEKINLVPIGALTYRDETENILIEDEDVTKTFTSLDNQADRKVDALATLTFQVKNYPLVKPETQAGLANHAEDIRVTFIDEKGNKQRAVVSDIKALEGKISLVTDGYFDPISLKIIKPPVPNLNNPVTKVFCSYQYNDKLIDTSLDYKIFYKITTVVETKEDQIIETPLEYVRAEDTLEFEKIDWIWREAIRRNKWILEQGGERVKVMIRKWMGEPCPCVESTTGQSINRCLTCFGTGIVGGYEGPFDILIPPSDTERQLPLTDRGIRLIYTYDCWTGPTPRLTERDVIIKPNNERYIVGPVSPIVVRGAMLQQSFSIQYIEFDDIRYKIMLGGIRSRPVSHKNSDNELVVETVGDPNQIPLPIRGKEQHRENELSPYITNHCGKPDGQEVKGRTRTFENITG